MKVVFAHDHRFRRIKNELYSTGGLSDDVLKRYTAIFENITVIARIQEENEVSDHYSKIINQNVEILSLNDIGKSGLIQRIKEADAVIARLPSIIGNKAVSLAKNMNKPYLIELVACPWDALWNYSLKGKIAAPYMWYITRKKVKDAPYVIYVTNKFLQRRYPTNGKSIGCSDVSLSEFHDTVLNARLIKIHNRNENDKIVLGTIAAVNVRYKGQRYVIEALAKLKKQGFTNYEYQLVGSGDIGYLKSLADKLGIASQIRFLGPLEHHKVFDWLDAIDLYIQPSLTEGLPRAVVEAMSRACPCLGSKTGGIPELLPEKATFCKKSSQELSRLLKNLDKNELSRYAEQNYINSKKYENQKPDNLRTKFYSDAIKKVQNRKMAEKKIIYIVKEAIYTYPPCISQIMLLNDNKINVKVICGDCSSDLLNEFKKRNISCIVIGNKRIPIKLFGKINSYLLFRFKAWRVIKKELESNTILWFGTVDGALALIRKFKNIPYVLSVLELYDKYKFYRSGLKRIIHNAAAIIACEDTRARIMKSWWNLKQLPYVMPNKPYFHPLTKNQSPSSKELADAVNKIKNKKIILYQGIISADRDLCTLAKALEFIDADYTLVLMGKLFFNGFEEIKKLYDNSIYLGYFKAPLHLQITSYAHIGVANYDDSSLNNLFCAPNKIYEYSGFGIPVLGSDVPGLINTIEKSMAGKCADFSNQDSIIDAIREIEKNYNKYSLNSKRFYSNVDNDKTIKDIIKDLVI